MNYVYVAGGLQSEGVLDLAITRQTKNALYSLIGGLKQADFGLHTIEQVTADIRQFSKANTQPVGGKILTDSGGYSFLRGDIEPSLIQMLIDCYAVYFESEYETYEYIFSLDMPYSEKYHGFNNKNDIYSANERSLKSAIGIIELNQVLQAKYYFVWHFKMASQFSMWNNLYKNLDLGRYVRNHAIGGMVGLKRATGIRYSPFTAMSFHALNSYLNSSFVGKEFRLHFLGIYSPQDRFHIAFLEALFQEYLAGISTVAMSYDSINPMQVARMNKKIPFFNLKDGSLEVYNSVSEIPISIINSIATSPEHVQTILEEIDRRNNGFRLQNAGSFGPFNVYSNLELDKFFAMVIKKYDLVSVMFHSTSPTGVNSRLGKVLGDLGRDYPQVFTRSVQQSIQQTVERTWRWHNWFVNGRNPQVAEELMLTVINEIGFPNMIS